MINFMYQLYETKRYLGSLFFSVSVSAFLEEVNI